MNENVKMFNEKMSSDMVFAEKLFSLATPEELQGHLKKNGMEFTIEEMTSLKNIMVEQVAKEKGVELSDADLDGVAGGGFLRDLGGAFTRFAGDVGRAFSSLY
jgi:predicted ribosomally synthesized peptide with nif11-like leader